MAAMLNAQKGGVRFVITEDYCSTCKLGFHSRSPGFCISSRSHTKSHQRGIDNKRVRGWESKEGDFTVIRGGFSNSFSKNSRHSWEISEIIWNERLPLILGAFTSAFGVGVLNFSQKSYSFRRSTHTGIQIHFQCSQGMSKLGMSQFWLS